MTNGNEKVFEAAKTFYEMLKQLGMDNPCVIYSYSDSDDEKDCDIIQLGFYGRANDVIATAERVKMTILHDAINDER